MSLTTYHHGVRVFELSEGARTIRTVSTAIIGLVATAEDADAATFPLDKPVLLTNVWAGISKAGTKGTLATALNAIAAQARPVVVVVRVAEGDTPAKTTTNVIGGVNAAGQYTGAKALLAAQAQLGVKPRILGAPGLDTQEVTAALVSIAQQLRGMVYASCHGAATIAAAETYREQFGQRELMLIYPDFTAWDSVASATAAVPAVAYALGLRAKIDEEIGWHKTLSNIVVNGPNGITRDVFFDLQSESTDAGILNAADITTLINQGGYRFWGSRTCSEDTNFAFESSTRTAQVLADTVAEAHFAAVDLPLLPGSVRDILDGVNAKLRELKTGGYILDGTAWLDEEINTADRLKAGKLVIDYDYTPVPPIEDLAFRQRITDRYYSDFASSVTSQAA